MAHFKEITSKPPSEGMTNAVIMGRKTWESIPPKFRPLPSRTNVILTKKAHYEAKVKSDCSDETLVASSLSNAIEQLSSRPNIGDIFVIGGGQVYEDAIKEGFVSRVYYTEVKNLPQETQDSMDAFFPELDQELWDKLPYDKNIEALHDDIAADESLWKTHEKSGLMYRFLDYQKKIKEGPHINPEEMQYLELCRDIIENGVGDENAVHFECTICTHAHILYLF